MVGSDSDASGTNVPAAKTQTEAINMNPLQTKRVNRFAEEKMPMCFIECNDTTIAPNVQFFQKKIPCAGCAGA
jgi:hypothetical protein